MGAGRQINNTVEAEQCRKHFRKVPLIKKPTRLSVEQSADCAPIYQSLKKVLVRCTSTSSTWNIEDSHVERPDRLHTKRGRYARQFRSIITIQSQISDQARRCRSQPVAIRVRLRSTRACRRRPSADRSRNARRARLDRESAEPDRLGNLPEGHADFSDCMVNRRINLFQRNTIERSGIQSMCTAGQRLEPSPT